MEGEDLPAELRNGEREVRLGGGKERSEREGKKKGWILNNRCSSPGEIFEATPPPISKTQYPLSLSLSLSFFFLFFPNMSC